MGMGVRIEVVEKKPWPPEEPITPIAGVKDFLTKYWPHLTIASIGTAIIGWLLGRK